MRVFQPTYIDQNVVNLVTDINHLFPLHRPSRRKSHFNALIYRCFLMSSFERSSATIKSPSTIINPATIFHCRRTNLPIIASAWIIDGNQHFGRVLAYLSQRPRRVDPFRAAHLSSSVRLLAERLSTRLNLDRRSLGSSTIV